MNANDEALALGTSLVANEPAVQFAEMAERCARSRLKRTLDIIGSGLGLVALSPLLGLVALVIYLQDRGPVLFRQQRTGLNGQVFLIWKFRTMRTECAGGTFRQTEGRDDPRITRLGRLLRATSLDELPQLLNVLAGEMSLVGPRPHPVALDQRLVDHFENYLLRQSVRPGLTGLAQIRGARGAILHRSDMERRLRHDLEYIRAWSVFRDLKIIATTLLSRSASERAF